MKKYSILASQVGFVGFSVVAAIFQKQKSLSMTFTILSAASGLTVVYLLIKRAMARDKHFAEIIATSGERYSEVIPCKDGSVIRDWAVKCGFKEHRDSNHSKLVFSKGGGLGAPTYISFDPSSSVLEMWIQIQGVAYSVMKGSIISIPRKKATRDLAALRARLGMRGFN